MVKIVNRELRAQCGGTSNLDGSIVLSIIESHGMLPPQVESSYRLYGTNVYRENNYWEPEDEQ